MIVRPIAGATCALWHGRDRCRLCWPAPAIAQGLAEQADQIICGYPAAGLTDIFARGLRRGRFAEDRPAGARSRTRPAPRAPIAAEQVKSRPADGHTLMWTISTTMIMNKVLFKKLPYDPDKDFVPISWMDAGHLPTIVQQERAGDEPQGVRRVRAQQQGVARHLRRGLLQPCRRSRR
jgi:tripartite-type tricarboxylate transporter receptor subunit TctC